MRLRNPAIAIVSGVLACCYVTRTVAGQVRSASEIRDVARGNFLFLDSASKPITVWFCRPSSITPDTRILFVMHGSESETARQACDIATPYLQPLMPSCSRRNSRNSTFLATRTCSET